MNPIDFKIEKTDHKISYEYVPVDAIFNIPIYDKSGDILGRALLTQNLENGENGVDLKEKVILTDIIVYDPDNRGRGIGDELMGFITTSGIFKQVLTGMSTKAGRALCIKWGFKITDIKGHKVLMWEKEESEA